MSDISNFVQRGTDTMLGPKISPVSPVSHGPCMQPITFCNGAALHRPRRHPTLLAIWHLWVPMCAKLTSLQGRPFRESLTHKLLTKSQKPSCSKHLVSQVSQRPESKTKEKAGKRHAHFSPHTWAKVTNVLQGSQMFSGHLWTCKTILKTVLRFTKVLKTVGNN